MINSQCLVSLRVPLRNETIQCTVFLLKYILTVSIPNPATRYCGIVNFLLGLLYIRVPLGKHLMHIDLPAQEMPHYLETIILSQERGVSHE